MRARLYSCCLALVPILSPQPAPPSADFYFRAPRAVFFESRTLDLDGDGRAERIEVSSRRARTLRISRGKRLLWSGVQARVKPWCLRVGDVDGDGRKEIALGTFKATRLWPRPHRTLSFYSWDGERARAKWLGSRLTLPFREFHLANVDADRADELLAIERDARGRWSLAVYDWDAFGFTLKTRVGSWNTARVLSVSARRIEVEADGRALRLP